MTYVEVILPRLSTSLDENKIYCRLYGFHTIVITYVLIPPSLSTAHSSFVVDSKSSIFGNKFSKNNPEELTREVGIDL
jgi:hypothetical protein